MCVFEKNTNDTKQKSNTYRTFTKQTDYIIR